MKLVYQSLITFFICSCIYSFFVTIYTIEKYEPLDQNQGNIISTQDFIFNKSKTADHIIVGSSLAYRLKNNMLPENYWNLAAGGGSLFKGLELIQIAEATPRVVLVETNFIERGANSIVGDFGGIDLKLKQMIPITQEKYKPIPYFINVVYQFFSNFMEKKSNPTISKKASKLMDDLQKNSYSKDIQKDSVVLLNILRLEKMVKELQEQGVCVIFFEMPISCTLDKLPKSISVRNLFAEYFPTNKFNYLAQSDCSNFDTTDGLHLDEPSAAKMLEYLISSVEYLNCN